MYGIAVDLEKNIYIFGDLYRSDLEMDANMRLFRPIKSRILGDKRPAQSLAERNIKILDANYEMKRSRLSIDSQVSKEVLASIGAFDSSKDASGTIVFDLRKDVSIYQYVYLESDKTEIRYTQDGERFISGIFFYSDFINQKTGNIRENLKIDPERKSVLVLSLRPKSLENDFERVNREAFEKYSRQQQAFDEMREDVEQMTGDVPKSKKPVLLMRDFAKHTAEHRDTPENSRKIAFGIEGLTEEYERRSPSVLHRVKVNDKSGSYGCFEIVKTEKSASK